jgi:hypothetical protein
MTRQGNSKSEKPTSVIPGRVDKIVVREVIYGLEMSFTF